MTPKESLMKKKADYWANRQENELNKISNKTEEEIAIQLNKYYERIVRQVIADFEAVYNKLMATITAGTKPTVADLYKLDRYWQMQANLRNLCEQLGNKEVVLLSKAFEEQWEETYLAASLPQELSFSQISESNAKAMIQAVWLNDGKTFSDRIWQSTTDLAATLNDDFVHLVVSGRSDTDLRKKLLTMVNDNVGSARSRVNTLIRTETAHIQFAAAEKRYKDSGVEEFIVLGREEHPLKCDCKKLDGTRWRFDDPNAPTFPRHPNCRCRIKPIPANDILQKRMEEVRREEQEKRAIKREADELREQAKRLRAQAATLKKQGKIEEAKQLEANARGLEKKYKELYAKLN
jgi:SPP1 gp7 family putative phage head morphogenesis protein